MTGFDPSTPSVVPPVNGVDGAAPPAASAALSTTYVTSADAIPAGPSWDPGTEHGYAGELAAVLIPADILQAKITDLARAVAADHTYDTPPLLICVLKGAVMFVTDFARALPIPSELEFMAVSSYGSATSSSGVVRILKDLDRDITGRRVIIVEDIIDSGSDPVLAAEEPGHPGSGGDRHRRAAAQTGGGQGGGRRPVCGL